MRKLSLHLLTCLALGSTMAAPPAPPGEGEPLPAQATAMKDIPVPVPREIFETLDRFRDFNWRAVQRTDIAGWKPRSEPADNALLLGAVIAEGFIAVAARDEVEVKSVGNAVLRFARSLGVERAALRRSRSIVEHAEEGDWPAVRKEWDRLLPDVQRGMNELKSEQLAQLVSLGGWLRGASALSRLVLQNYSAQDAELLRQSGLLDYFEARLAEMDGEIRANPNVVRVRAEIPGMRELLAHAETPIPKERVKKISGVAEALLKDLGRKRRSESP
jgi:flagellar biosynthesis regulator FlaF